MALRKKRLGAVKSSSNTNLNVVGDGPDGGLELRLDSDKHKKRFGKKKVLISSGKIQDSKNICEKTVDKTQEFETLPQDILIKIICGVEHGDLKQLCNVSKTIRDATLIAKKCHFEYSTPRKTLFFRDCLDSMIDFGDVIEVPLVKKHQLSKITCENRASKISVSLFK
ncbi:hypothetical protein Bca4012_061595 [Brassica carinata]|uniref:F-box domain-containing protein n=1 Tax=Brassica carinata TaxID=52824 RepID=A0A8X7U6C9_BRACI|nr:hypothetical protein Bca52824_062470 [Brassica carinata]